MCVCACSGERERGTERQRQRETLFEEMMAENFPEGKRFEHVQREGVLHMPRRINKNEQKDLTRS